MTTTTHVVHYVRADGTRGTYTAVAETHREAVAQTIAELEAENIEEGLGEGGYTIQLPEGIPGHRMIWCPTCEAYADHGSVEEPREHLCTIFDGPPCGWQDSPGRPGVCGMPTVFVHVAAPGTGSGYTCKAGHYTPVTPTRILTIDDVR